MTFDESLQKCQEAERFKLEFEPQEGVNYSWVVAYAKDEYARAVEIFKRLDDKAATVANYLGAGAGLLTLGSVSALASATISHWIILAATPSIALAMGALVVAVGARRAAWRSSPPTVADAVAYAEFFRDPRRVGVFGDVAPDR